jgi:hypothetical protein
MQARKPKWTPNAVSEGCRFAIIYLAQSFPMLPRLEFDPASLADRLLSQDFYGTIISIDKEARLANPQLTTLFGRSGGLFDP